MERKHNVLIVCDGNAGRSPAAAIIMKAEADKIGFPLNISTAGLKEYPDWHGGIPEMNDVLKILGYPSIPDTHRPTRVDSKVLLGQDIVFGFERRHVRGVRLIAPHILSARVDTLTGYAGFPNREIADPDNLMRDTLYSRLVRNISSDLVRQVLYGLGGYIHPNDYLLVPDVYLKTAKGIQFYIPKIAKRIQQQFGA